MQIQPAATSSSPPPAAVAATGRLWAPASAVRHPLRALCSAPQVLQHQICTPAASPRPRRRSCDETRLLIAGKPSQSSTPSPSHSFAPPPSSPPSHPPAFNHPPGRRSIWPGSQHRAGLVSCPSLPTGQILSTYLYRCCIARRTSTYTHTATRIGQRSSHAACVGTWPCVFYLYLLLPCLLLACLSCSRSRPPAAGTSAVVAPAITPCMQCTHTYLYGLR